MLLRKICSCLLPILFTSSIIIAQNCPGDELALSIVQFNLNSCTALSNGSSNSYAEFTGLSSNKSDCADINVVGNGGALYRLNPDVNGHSCTPGIDGTAGMCVSGDESCSFRRDSEHAVRFNVEVVPGADLAQLKTLTFYEKAPINYEWIDGDTGKNNFPTKYGIRVSVDGREVYRIADIETGHDWSLQTIDLSFVSGFVVDEPTIFSFELLGYCPVDNGANLSIWDIDHIRLYGGCLENINGGMISSDDETNITTCASDGQSDLIDPDIRFSRGPQERWVITDNDGNIIDLPSSPPFDFEDAGVGVCLIWNMSFEGNISGLSVGRNVSDLQGCFDFSNPITVNREDVSNTTIFIDDNSGELDEITLCTNDGEDDLVFVGARSNGGQTSIKDWVITDDSGVILNADATQPFNFEGIEGGTCLIWQVSYREGLVGNQEGENIADLEGCFSISNSVTVFRNQPEGGTISFNHTQDEEIEICAGDGFSDEFDFRLTGERGNRFFWVISSIEGRILSVSNDDFFDFEPGGFGTYIVQHIGVQGSIQGLIEGNDLDDVTGCFNLSNRLVVRRNYVNAGSISVGSGNTTSLCIDNGDSNFVDIDLDQDRNVRENTAWLITTTGGTILDLPTAPPFDFSDMEGGAKLIWHLSYSDIEGLEVGDNANNLDGCFDLSEPIEINVGLTDGGTIAGGPYIFCVGDGDANFIPNGDISLMGTSGSNSQWVITDDRGDILGLPDRPSDVNFDDAPEGVCLVWHLSYEDDLEGLEVGNDLRRDLEGCFDLSNAIEVTRTSVVGGELVGGPFGFCVGDGIIDTIVREDLELFRWRGSNRIWFVTDTEGNILSTPVRPSLVNFDDAPAGTCLIWHASFEGEIDGTEVGSNINDITGCFDLSNSVTVNRGGTDDIVIEGGPFEFCVSNGSPDMIPTGAINNNTNSGNGVQWVVTDADGEILGLPEHPTDVDFDDAGEGTCLIWLINYEGISGLELGNNALTDLDGCFSISNSIEVSRTAANGGELEGGPFSFCVGDGIEDRIAEDDVRLFGREGESRRWLVTDESGNILDIPADPSDVDFDSAPPGVCLLWHLSFSGEIDGVEVGANANAISGCFDLSNPLTIVRGGPTDITLTGGPFTFCVADGRADRLSSDDLSLNVASGEGAQWVVTDEDGSIIGLPERPTDVNFDEAGEGTCFIYFVSFAGEVTGLALEENIDDLDGCISVSNPITVNRNAGNGGELAGGPFNFCIGDGEDDFIDDDDLILTGSAGTSRWVVTDPAGVILNLPVRPSLVNFENLGSGTCLIWHVGFSGDIEGLEEGANALNLSGCFSISNPISVFRLDPEGGTLTGGPFEFCVGDGTADNIPENAISISGNEGSNTQWIVTDEDGDILGLPASPSEVNFEEAGGGTCFIWSLSSEGDVVGLETGNNINTDLEGCLSISNSVAVIRNVAVGGELTGGPFSFCVGDGEDDFIDEDDIVLTGNAGDNSRWIVTDQAGNILSIPVSPSLVNFDEAESGTCLIWHVGFSGEIGGLEVGSNASDLMGCFDLSNSIAVVRSGAEALTIEGGPFSFCVDDGTADAISAGDITPNINSATGVQWVITDDNNQIIGLPANPTDVDFETAGAGTCFIYLVSFAGDISGLELESDITSDLAGCFNVSNSIEVSRSSANGGELAGGPFNVCVGDGEDDFIGDDSIVLTGSSGESSRWLVTDEAGNILSIPVSPSLVNFEDAGAGTCLIWHLGFSGDLVGLEVGQNANNLSGCFSLSNPISVVRSGTEALTIGGGPFSFCVGDGVADAIDVGSVTPNVTSGTGLQWVITDDNNQIIGLPGSPSDVDFDTAGEGTCFIYLVSFAGEITGLELESDITADLAGCFNVSNSITVTRSSAGGGELTGGPFNVCVGDGEDDFISDDSIVLTGNSGESSRWLVTDEAGNILSIPVSPSLVNFEDAGTGTCLIWHLGFSGDLVGLEVGQNANNLSGCFSLSNPISVIRSGTEALTIEGGPFSFCVGDGVADAIDMGGVMPNITSGTGVQWVITDDNNQIIGLPGSPADVDFDTAGEGTCFIYLVSFAGDINGLELDNDITADLAGCFNVSNSIEVTRNSAGGGELAGGPFNVCVGDGEDDFISDDSIVLTGDSGESSRWLVTDEAGNILSIPVSPSLVNFEDAGTGTCLIWHLGFSGDLVGLEVGQNANDLSGCFDLSNPISVIRSGADDISLEGGPFTFCVGNGEADMIADGDLSVATPSGAGAQWVVTDDNGEIIGLPTLPTDVNFDDAGEGVCFIYFVSFSGDLFGLELGNNINADLIGCHSVSNSVAVNRNAAGGGELSGGPFNFCVGDGVNDFIGDDEIILTGSSADNTRWLVTDAAGNILSIPVRPSIVNFEDAGTGTCLIWHLGFSGDITGLEVGQNANNLSGCFDLSNPVTVIRSGADEIVLEGGPFTFCVGDDSADRLSENDLSINTPSGVGAQWVITDDNDNIIGLPQSPTEVNFNDVEEGTCFIYFVSFSGDITGLELESNIDALAGCFSVSNAVSVIRTSADGGELTGGPFNFCVGDGIVDFIGEDDIVLSGRSGDSRRWLITDESGVILNIPVRPSLVNFEEFGGGTCLIWHLSFSGELDDLAEGFNVLDLEGCFDLSEPIPVFRSGVEGGVLAGGPYEFCVRDSDADFVDVTLSGNDGANSQWIITDGQSNILALPNDIQNFDFNETDAGICLIWHLSHDNDLEGLAVGNNVSALSGCLSLSNSIMVTRNEGVDCIPPCEVEGGVLAGGPFSFCVGDGVSDTIAAGAITISGVTGPNQQWVVTDADGNILGLPSDPSEVDFDVAGAGECLIWNLTFEEGLTGAAVGNNANQLEGCFDLSNPISVVRSNPQGGILSPVEFSFCVGDGVADTIASVSISLIGNVGSNTQWVVTDVAGTILDLPADISDVNFDIAPAGICLVWSLSFEDGLTGATVGSSANDLAGCFSLSNPVTVNRNTPNGGTITGGPFEFCVGDSIPDFITAGSISLAGNVGDSTQWIVTDTLGNIIGLPGMPSEVDFEDAPAGVCLVWHLSYYDSISGLSVGNNTNDITGCISLSNSISVNRVSGDDCVAPCEITVPVLAGGPFSFCVGDSIADNITPGQITVTEDAFVSLQWIVTDDQGIILGLPDDPANVNFDDAGAGTCLIWLANVQDSTTVFSLGVDATTLEGCYTLSNPVTVNRNQPMGGTLTGGPFTFCVGDSIADNIPLDGITLAGNVGNSQWLVTDTLGNILGLPAAPSDVDFDDAGSGTCLVWHLSSVDSISGAAVGMNANNITGCFSLSNPVTVNRTQPIGGTIAGGPFSFCVGDSIADMIPDGAVALTGNSGTNSQWVITDDLGTIIGLPASPSDVNFEDAESGLCFLWHLSFEDGLQGAVIDSSASDLSGCFSLSNPIEIERNSGEDCPEVCDAMANVLTGGPFTFCVGDMEVDNIPAGGVELTVTDSTLSTQWVITDTLGVIIGLPTSPTIVDFNNLRSGTCLVWNVAFTDSTTVFAIDANANNLGGCYALSNPVTVIRNQTEGGTLTGGPFTFCASDGVADTIPIGGITLSGNIGPNSAWVVTDTAGMILGLPATPSDVDFDDAGVGTCFVWHLSFADGLVGAAVGSSADSLMGCFSLSNPITVTRAIPEAGVLNGGPFSFCVGDGSPDFIPLDSLTLTGNSLTANSQWVVTDTTGIIETLPAGFEIVNFEGVGAGTSLIWHLSFEGALDGGTIGSSVDSLVGCFSLSNSVRVDRVSGDDCPVIVCEAVGGMLTGGPFEFCVGDGIPDTIAINSIALDSASGDFFQWVVTDDSGIIIGLPEDPSSVNFDIAPAGTCVIQHLSGVGTVGSLAIGNNLITDITGCFDISNGIVITRRTGDDCPSCDALGGRLIAADFEFCGGDGIADMIDSSNYVLIENAGMNQQWVIYDNTGRILGLPIDPTNINFEILDPNVYLISVISFDEELENLVVNGNLAGVSGCFGVSEPIMITVISPSGGTIQSDPFVFCAGDGIPDIIRDSIAILGATGETNRWIITDQERNIIGLPLDLADVDFDQTGVDTSLIWNVSFIGTLDGLSTVNTTLDDLSGCFGLSDALAVNRVGGDDCLAIIGRPIINEVTDNDQVEIKNIGASPIDISEYWLCNRPLYDRVNSLDIVCGGNDYVINPGEEITLQLDNVSLSGADGELALYINNLFADSDAIIDYVEWGSGQHGRETVAVAAGIWTAGDFVVPFGLGRSISYDGDGDASTDWMETDLNLCAEASFVVNPQERLSMKIFPVPAVNEINFELNQDLDEVHNVSVVDNYGHVLMTKEMDRADNFSMDISNLQAGIYYLKVKSGRHSAIERFIIVN